MSASRRDNARDQAGEVGTAENNQRSHSTAAAPLVWWVLAWLIVAVVLLLPAGGV